MNICLGGTFDPMHKGHRALFDKAIDLVGKDKLYVGLTGDGFAAGSRNGQDISCFEERKRNIEKYLEDRGVEHTIVVINDRYGIAHQEESFEAIVVSQETYLLAVSINQLRVENDLNRLHIFVVDMVRNPRGEVIKGTSIRNGKMDTEGAPLENGGGGP